METDNLANWLLKQEPSLVLQWLHEMLEGTRPLPEGFDWRGLAECAASDTFQKSENASLPNLGWANVAVLAYSYVLQEEKKSMRLAHNPEMKKFSYLSLELALMRVQARCILTFGHVAGDPVLDVDHLIQRFFEDLPFSPAEALQKYTEESKELTSNEYRELYRIRRKLQILQPLEQEHVLPSNPDLLLWFSVSTHIPQFQPEGL